MMQQTKTTAAVRTLAVQQGKKLLILDVDVGVDDTQALMMALTAPNVHILAITCTGTDNVCKNVLRVLKLCNRMEIPVYRGSATSLLGALHLKATYQVKDCMGDLPDPDTPGVEHINSEHAVHALARIANEHPGQITLVGLGHLTNVALAAKMHPTFSSKLKSLYIMGGNMDDFLRAKGDVKVFGAFNFFTDPEAASIVLSHFTCPIYIATLEYCFRHRLPWGTNQDSAKTQSTKKVAAQTADSSQESQSSKGMQSASGFVSYDSYAMSAAIDDSLVTERAQYGVSVELHGSLTRGMMVVDTLDILKLQHKATVFLECDMEKLKQLMIKVQ